ATRLHSRGAFIGAWWCLMAGTLLRVPSQALYTAIGGPFVLLLGISGAVQLAALMLFAWNLWRTLDTSAAHPAEAAARAPVPVRGGRLPGARRPARPALSGLNRGRRCAPAGHSPTAW